MRLKLARHQDVIYFPLRILKARSISNQSLEDIQNAQHLILTSNFGIEVFSQLTEQNPNAQIHVISKKAANLLREKGIKNQVVVSRQENRNSLMQEISDIKDESVCWLIGDLAEEKLKDAPGQKIIIYENTWDEEHQGQLFKILLKNNLTKILVTSTSNAKRLIQAMEMLSSTKDYQRIDYFVLGESTGQYLENENLRVAYPTVDQGILEENEL